ncbi:MAG: hypothetical protein HC934_04005 [Acaryochloridaceae cyanobacterium SU_2_1]|nr:hypothetical protein [Acaryochloridaceae cyanobacterium SU_2_1]
MIIVQLLVEQSEPWFPRGWRNQGFEENKVRQVLEIGLPWLQRIKSISRPGLTQVCTAIALMSISMMIPIPGTNTLPAMGIFVTGYGLLNDDGAISLGGLALCVCGFILTSSFGGSSLIDIIKDALER